MTRREKTPHRRCRLSIRRYSLRCYLDLRHWSHSLERSIEYDVLLNQLDGHIIHLWMSYVFDSVVQHPNSLFLTLVICLTIFS